MNKQEFESIIEFLKRPDIRECLQKKDFDCIYNQVNDSVDFEKDELTQVFKTRVGIDPLKYIKKYTSDIIPNNVKFLECQNNKVQYINIGGNDNLITADFAACTQVDEIIIRNCPKLEEIGLPPLLKRLPNRSMSYLPALGPVLVLPETCEFLGDECFRDNTNLQEIVILAETMPKLMGQPFNGCTKLTKIQFPNLKTDEVLPKLMNHLTEDNIANIGFRFNDNQNYEQTSEIEMMAKLFGIDPDDVVKELMNDKYIPYTPEEDED